MGLVLLLLQNGIEHAVPVRLEPGVEVRGLAWCLNDLEIYRTPRQELGVLSPREEAGADSSIEWRQSEDVDLSVCDRHMYTFGRGRGRGRGREEEDEKGEGEGEGEGAIIGRGKKSIVFPPFVVFFVVGPPNKRNGSFVNCT